MTGSTGTGAAQARHCALHGSMAGRGPPLPVSSRLVPTTLKCQSAYIRDPVETVRSQRPGEGCDQVLASLRAHLPDLGEQFGVSEVALFSPVARGEAGPGSNIGLMVALDQPLGWDLVLLHDHLESILGAPVDLAVRGGLMRRPGLWDRLSRELVYVGPDDVYSAR